MAHHDNLIPALARQDASHPSLKVLKDLGEEISLLSHTMSLLSWDQEVYMPSGGIEERSRQLAFLSTLAHHRLAGDELGRALEDLGASDQDPCGKPSLGLSWQEGRLVRLAWRTRKRAATLSSDHVAEMSRTVSLSQDQWVKSRHADDFRSFRPWLEKLVDLKTAEAGLIDPAKPAYDVLLDEFEPDMSAKVVQEVFDGLRDELVPFLARVLEAAKSRPDPMSGCEWPVEGQKILGKRIITDMGYPDDQGRMDVSAHPFTITTGRRDVRVTSRYSASSLGPGISGLVHETGHALYELGFSPQLDDFLANASSLGIHESQSRLWENMVGRSLGFWTHYEGELRKLFPSAMAGHGPEDLWRSANQVALSHIRVDADEVSYSLHVMLRFNLERRLFAGTLSVADLPEAWREESRKLLGIVPASDRDGVLQDIHWSMGSFGYFPTYVLGNLYGAMFWSQAKAEIKGLEAGLARGEFRVLREWLGQRIHSWGATMTPGELLGQVCGKSLDARPFMDYLKEKYGRIYSL